MQSSMPFLPENNQDNLIPPPQLQDSLEAHVEYVYRTIYSKPYLIPIKYSREFTEVPRMIHGIQHVTRVAIDIPVFVNLYRRYGNAEAIGLTNDDIKLCQIAALFHDAARKNEGVDEWDNESAWLLYCYLTEKMNVDLKKAKLLAEAIANKDAKTESYVELEVTSENTPCWVKNPKINCKNIYQKLLQNADSLDIIRAVDFDGTRLDFYKEIAKNNPVAFDELAKLINEKTSLIERQGDSKGRMNPEIKEKYNHHQAYQAIIADINKHKNHYKIYHTFHANNTVLTGDSLSQELVPVYSDTLHEAKSITVESLTAAKNKGRLFVRGISAPQDISSVSTKDESAATISVRKMTGEDGDTHRSVTLLDSLYTGQGFLIQNPEIDQIEHIYHTDANTGRGEKKDIKPSELSREEKIEQLDQLHRKVKMGGTAKKLPDGTVMTHHEIIYTVTCNDAHAIYFSEDPNHYNRAVYGNPYAPNRFTHYMQALRLQKTYLRDTGITLPIFECSGIHDFIKPAPRYTENQHITMWVIMVSELMKHKLKSNGQITETMESLKIEVIDGYTLTHTKIIRKQLPVDKLFPTDLLSRISTALEDAKIKCIAEHKKDIIERIKNGSLSVLDNEAFKTLLHSPCLIAEVQPEIDKQCNAAFNLNNDRQQGSLKEIDNEYYPVLNYDNYFRSDIAKIFHYAHATNNLTLFLKIKHLAENTIKEEIASIKKALFSNELSFIHEYLRNLIDYSARFYFYDDMKGDINNIIIQIINQLYNSNNFYEFNRIITILHQADFLKGDMADFCLDVVNKFKKNHIVAKNSMDALLELEKEMTSPSKIELIPFVKKLKKELPNVQNVEIEQMSPLNSRKRTHVLDNNVRATKSPKSNKNSPDSQNTQSTRLVKSPSNDIKRIQLPNEEVKLDDNSRKLKSPRLAKQSSNITETKDSNTRENIAFNTAPSSNTRFRLFKRKNDVTSKEHSFERHENENTNTNRITQAGNRLFKRIAGIKKPKMPKKLKQATNKLNNIIHRR